MLIQSLLLDFVIIDDLHERTARLLKPASNLRKTICYDSSEMWRPATSYLIENAGDEAETGTKKQNMSIRKPDKQVWCMKINVCSKQMKLIFLNIDNISW